MVSLDPSGIYEELGANPVINAIGSLTLLGGSTPPTEVKEAMEAVEGARRQVANIVGGDAREIIFILN